MKQATLEHINLSVRDPDTNAQAFCKLFGWKIRWSGPSMNNGYTVHVGTDTQYISFYTCDRLVDIERGSEKLLNLNHIAVMVDDFKQAEKAVLDAGYTPFNYGDYDPGRRFYFLMHEDLEIEVVSYAEPTNIDAKD